MAAVAGLYDQTSRTVALAIALATSGRTIETDGLDRNIGLLCAKTLDLEPSAGRALRDQLMSLLVQIDRLRAALEITQDTAARQKAVSCTIPYKNS